jgi:hypothetical protein
MADVGANIDDPIARRDPLIEHRVLRFVSGKGLRGNQSAEMDALQRGLPALWEKSRVRLQYTPYPSGNTVC